MTGMKVFTLSPQQSMHMKELVKPKFSLFDQLIFFEHRPQSMPQTFIYEGKFIYLISKIIIC
jgi:hypothetical protein